MDAVVRLLDSGLDANVSAVAAEAGLSRPTVYSHFPDHRQMLAAVVARAVGQAVTSIEAAEPDRGSAAEALDRVVAASWDGLGRHASIAAAAQRELGAEAMHEAHREAIDVVRRLIERGVADGSFRTDLEPGWLLASFFSLAHMAREEVRAARLNSESAQAALSTTVRELFKR